MTTYNVSDLTQQQQAAKAALIALENKQERHLLINGAGLVLSLGIALASTAFAMSAGDAAQQDIGQDNTLPVCAEPAQPKRVAMWQRSVGEDTAKCSDSNQLQKFDNDATNEASSPALAIGGLVVGCGLSLMFGGISCRRYKSLAPKINEAQENSDRLIAKGKADTEWAQGKVKELKASLGLVSIRQSS